MKKIQKVALYLIIAAVLASLAGTYFWIKGRKITEDHITTYLNAKREYTRGNLNKAIELTTLLDKKSPNLFQAKLLLGKSYYLTDQFTEANKIFGKLVKKYPGYLEAGVWKSRCEIQLDMFDQAYTRIHKLLSFNSDDPKLLTLMGNLEELKGELGRAIDFYERASLYEEELAKNRLSLGKLYSRLGVYDKSYNELKNAKELLEKDSPLYKPILNLMEEVSYKEKGE